MPMTKQEIIALAREIVRIEAQAEAARLEEMKAREKKQELQKTAREKRDQLNSEKFKGFSFEELKLKWKWYFTTEPKVDVNALPARFQRIKVEPNLIALKAGLEDKDPQAMELAELVRHNVVKIYVDS